ncbi:MAG TPA: histidine phosphatase family protein [bacterium]|nr:histidine phosphatase family protein [bacterium]HPT29607.1 histidine phosphatase family protein [bacterium]
MTKRQYQNPYIKLKPKTRQPYTVIYLVRHGNPDYSTEKTVGDFNMPLSVVGLKQRQYLTKIMLKKEIDKIYASELLRSQETARPLVEKTGKKLIIDERLNEIDWHDWHRIKYFNTSETARKSKLVHYRRLDKQLDTMQTEARRLLADIYHHNRGKRVALFCHGNIIKTIITSIVNADIIGFLSLEIYQSSISKLVIDRDGYIKVGYINNISHLPHEPNEDLFITLVD